MIHNDKFFNISICFIIPSKGMWWDHSYRNQEGSDGWGTRLV